MTTAQEHCGPGPRTPRGTAPRAACAKTRLWGGVRTACPGIEETGAGGWGGAKGM